MIRFICVTSVLLSSVSSFVWAETVPEARLRYLRGDLSAIEQTIRPAAEAGHPQAMNLMGDAHQRGTGAAQDDAAALDWFQRAAQAGSTRAIANLGDIFADGELGQPVDDARAAFLFQSGLPLDVDGTITIEYADFLRNAAAPYRDADRALRIVQEAAAQGKREALSELGYFYATGTLVDVDLDRARALFERADAQGHPKAARNLGFMYDDGIGVTEDDARALGYYLRGAAAGDSEAQADAALMLWEGSVGVAPDPERAIALARGAAARLQGKAFEFLGDRAYYGEGMAQDRARAAQYYENAWDQGRAYGGYALGWQLVHGDGVPTDTARGIDLYRAAAQAGQHDAAWELGQMIHEGTAQGSVDEMLRLLQQASNAGLAGAENELGLIFDAGRKVPRDAARALGHFERAADMGDPWAMRNVGLMLIEEGAPDAAAYARAEALFARAANEGVAEAWTSLGALYHEGLGRPIDVKAALRYYRRGGEAGHAHGYIDAAELLLDTDPGPMDIVRAQGFLKKAAALDPHAYQHMGDGWRIGQFGPVDFTRAYQFYTRAFEEARDADAAARIAQMVLAGEGPFADAQQGVLGLAMCLYAKRNDSELDTPCDDHRASLTPVDIAAGEARADNY